MRNLIPLFCLAALFLLTAPSAHAQNQAKILKDLDKRYGFREMGFGADTTEFTDLVFVGAEKGLRLYHRRDDFMKIGPADVDEITYAFYKGKLLRAIVKVRGTTNTLALEKALQAQYGPGTYLPNHAKASYWASKRVMVVYDENIISNAATMMTWSKTLEAQKVAEETRAAKSAGTGL